MKRTSSPPPSAWDHQQLLKKVARSFYLTIRFLPSVLQEPVTLAYLLARASDTMADGEELSLEEKESALRLLKDELDQGREKSDFLVIQSNISKFIFQFEGEEQELLLLFPVLFEQLYSEERSQLEYEAIKNVWQKILEGQLLDLQLFPSDKDSKILSAEELDRYLYLVAGSVGEFLTTLSVLYFKDFSKESLLTMILWGSDYGKGLQLTNILRDRLEDKQRGRCYCTEAQVVRFHEQALVYLQQGRRYVNSLRRGRLKYALALPLLLAEQTLALVQKNPSTEKVKVSRLLVYGILIRALPLLFF